LQNVCLSARGNTLEILGTDMEIGVRHRVEEVEIEEEGDILLPGARFQGIVRELADGRVDVVSKDLQAEIRAPGCYFKLVGEEPADFPTVPPFPKGNAVEVPGELLGNLIRRSSFAAAVEETRYAIHGVLVEFEGKDIRMVATDGKRLAWAGSTLEQDLEEPCTALLPPRALLQILKGLEPGDDTVRMIFEERRVIAQAGRSTVVASRIDGTFPGYEEVVPKGAKISAEVDRDTLSSCVRRGALLATEGSQAVSVSFSSGSLKVGARASNVGEGEIEMSIAYDGDTTEIHFNPRYLLDFLKVAHNDMVRVEFNDARSAVLFLDGPDLKYVVMPVTLETLE
jgi:DNA polymerase-3 subunit beta